jgi:ribonuclease HI
MSLVLSEKQSFFLYTDASFSHLENLGVSGFYVFEGTSQHENSQPNSHGLKTYFFKEENNIRAEIVGALFALNHFMSDCKAKNLALNSVDLNLYSDCQTLTNLLSRREKLEATDYISERKKTTLVNADLYKQFFKVYDDLKPQIHWLEGHFKKATMTLTQKNFQVVDKQVRKELRTLVKEKQPAEAQASRLLHSKK